MDNLPAGIAWEVLEMEPEDCARRDLSYVARFAAEIGYPITRVLAEAAVMDLQGDESCLQHLQSLEPDQRRALLIHLLEAEGISLPPEDIKRIDQDVIWMQGKMRKQAAQLEDTRKMYLEFNASLKAEVAQLKEQLAECRAARLHELLKAEAKETVKVTAREDAGDILVSCETGPQCRHFIVTNMDEGDFWDEILMNAAALDFYQSEVERG